jgi:hypothetical protein
MTSLHPIPYGDLLKLPYRFFAKRGSFYFIKIMER